MREMADMKLLYINDELATGDGSNSHAVGMLRAFESILGKENVVSFPKAEDGSGKPVHLGANKLKKKLKAPLAVARFYRKKYLSVKRSKAICRELLDSGFVPTHVMARSTNFDVTAISVAKAFGAKLIYEVNTPMFYESGVIKKEPMLKQIEAWEKKIIDASDNVYVVSKICRDMLCEHYHVPEDKFLVIPNGYMGELYHEGEQERREIRERIRNQEGLTDQFVVAFVGSLKVWHGIKRFCETAQEMEQDESIVFLVLGDGEMHDLIADYAKNHSNMIFKGKVNLETMKNYLYASDIGIMPYEKADNFYYSPLKMYDMIGAGLPFLGTAVGQIEELCCECGASECLITDNRTETIVNAIRNAKNSGIANRKRISGEDKTWLSRTEQLVNAMKCL